MSEDYLDVPDELKDLDHIDFSYSKIKLGSKARNEARQVFKNFYASNRDQLNEQTIGYYIDQFMKIINNGER